MKPLYFEIMSYAGWIVAAILVAWPFKNKREYWFALLGISLTFPFEWVSDYLVLFMKYDRGFVPLFSYSFMPLMMAFSYGWFFALTLIVSLQFEEKLNKLPVWGQALLLYLIYVLWDFLVEFSSTSFKLWTYYSSAPKIGGLPWIVPFAVAVANVGFFFVHKLARKYSTGKHWFPGFLIHLASYWGWGVVYFSLAWVFNKIVGIHPTIDLWAKFLN